MEKPANIKVGFDEKLPVSKLFLFGLQHALAMASTIVLSVLIMTIAGASTGVAEQFIQLSMLGMGIATILLALSNRFIGSGYLCPNLCAPGYYAVEIMAVKAGGLPVMYGMNFLASLFSGALAFLVPKLRQFFPTYVAGVVVFMISVTLIIPSILDMTQSKSLADVNVHSLSLVVAVISLLLMILITLWGRALSQYALLISVIIGCGLAWYFGIIKQGTFTTFQHAAMFSLPNPQGYKHLSFSLALLVPFAVAALCVTLQAVGNIMTCQRINDKNWIRPDMQNIKKGILAGSLANIVGSLLGGMPVSTSSSNVGLSVATGVTSRFIGFSAGIIYIILSCSPKLASVLLIIPKPVQGAILLFVASFMLIAGIRIIGMGREDIRKTFVIGLSTILGVSAMVMPAAVIEEMPQFLIPIFDSPLALATIVAFVTNMIFRIGVTRHASMKLIPEEGQVKRIWEFIERQGGYWFALPEISQNGARAVSEAMEALAVKGVTQAILNANFDDFNLGLEIVYDGSLLDLNVEKPSKELLRHDINALADLAICMMKEYADKVEVFTRQDKSVLKLELCQ